MIQFKHLEKVLTEYAEAIVDKYKQNLESSGRRASGNLIDTIKTNVTYNNNEFTIELNLADYWYYVENGRGPTQTTAPSQPTLREKILEWIKVKGIPTTGMNPRLPEEKKLEQLAFLITRKIHTEGFEGSNDLEHTMEEVNYETLIEEALEADVMDCFDELLLFLK